MTEALAPSRAETGPKVTPPQIAWSNDDRLTILASPHPSAAARRFLVFVVPRADRPSPLLKVMSSDRNFDVAARFYDHPGSNTALAEQAEFVMTGGLSKFHSASLFFTQCPAALGYDGYLFVDGDLAFDGARLGDFLAFSHALDLDLAQPAVTRDSFCFWHMAYVQPRFLYRETSFVEVMCPYFSRRALSLTRASFARSISSYGLDLVWPSLVGSSRIAVVDAFQIRHAETVDLSSGPFYRYLQSRGIDPEADECRMLAEYGVAPHRAHSRRGIFRPDGGPTLRSVPLFGPERLSTHQRLIDFAMAVMRAGPSRLESARVASLGPLVRKPAAPQEASGQS